MIFEKNAFLQGSVLLLLSAEEELLYDSGIDDYM